MGGWKKKKEEKQNQVSKHRYHLTSGMAVKLGLPQTSHSWAVSSALSWGSDRRHNRIPAREPGPGTEPLLPLKQPRLQHPAGAGTRTVHSCSGVNHTGSPPAYVQMAVRRGSEATEKKGKLLEQKDQSNGSSQDGWDHKPPNSVSINKAARTWFALCPPRHSPNRFHRVPMTYNRTNKAAPTLCSTAAINIHTWTLQSAYKGCIIIFTLYVRKCRVRKLK